MTSRQSKHTAHQDTVFPNKRCWTPLALFFLIMRWIQEQLAHRSRELYDNFLFQHVVCGVLAKWSIICVPRLHCLLAFIQRLIRIPSFQMQCTKHVINLLYWFLLYFSSLNMTRRLVFTGKKRKKICRPPSGLMRSGVASHEHFCSISFLISYLFLVFLLKAPVVIMLPARAAGYLTLALNHLSLHRKRP